MKGLTKPQNNPWSEDPERLSGLAISQLAKLNALIKSNRTTLPKETEGLLSKSEAVIVILQRSDVVYRNNRRLFVQQIPAFVKLINTLAETAADSNKSIEVRSELTKVVAVATAHLSAEFSTISHRTIVEKAKNARLSWYVLPGVTDSALGATAETLRDPVGALRNLATSASTTVTDAASGALSTINSIASVSADRINAAGKMAQIAGTTALTTAHSHTFGHAMLYSKAAIKTVWATGGLAMVVGLVTLVICSQAAPFAAGLMVFYAPGVFAEILEADMSEAERERALRNAGAEEEMITAWAQLKGQRIIRIDTPYVTADLDVINKQIDGTILAGKYAGQRLSQLDVGNLRSLEHHAPDSETKELLSKYLGDQ